ncbi:MAG TPA: hypothetical protein VIZ31_01645 [Vicinamibacteria bacterium]
MDLFDPNHHLERRRDGFWLRITLHGGARPRRLRVRLGTHVVATARRRRDALLRPHADADAFRTYPRLGPFPGFSE